MPTIEQPSAAQKFSAQEFLKALRSAEKNETILPSARAARKEAHPEAHTANGKEIQQEQAVIRLTREQMMADKTT